MAEIPVEVEVSVTFSTEDGTSVEDAIEDYLKHVDALTPARVYSDCPHASWVEFGTLPASRKSTGIRPVLDILTEWAEKKLGLKDEEAKRVAKAVYHKILKTGMQPAPFFRPAIYDTLSEVEAKAETWFAEGYTIEDIAKRIAEKAILNLKRNNQNYTYDLSNSIAVDTAREGPIVDDGRTVEGEVDEFVWSSSELGRDGVSRPNFQRWSRW